MLRYLLIAVILPLKLLSQLSAPDLRCLEVLANGNIKLTWIPPSDPGNTFFSYEIFSSVSATGPFANAGSVGALATNSFVHVGAAGNVQSRYYFVKTTSGAGGATVSPASDTLRSIFLNVIPSVPDLKLQYNQLHAPKLSTSAPTFTVTKEYPSATWNILGITSGVKYADTISVCSASINYQVSQSDNSGCISVSNIQGGVYNDTKSPDIPEIDSISVLPNGSTIIAWKIPRDMDIEKYQIYQNISGVNVAIDNVMGRPSSFYTFTTTIATSQALSLYVAAIDSCGQIGGFNITPSTMFLKADYDRCGYKTTLNWNAYPGIKNGVLEYRIYYSVNGSTYVKVGSTTQTSFTHLNVAPAQNISYFVRVINNAKNITASSNRTVFFSSQAAAPDYVYISRANVLSKNSVELGIAIDNSKQSQGIDIWRSVDGGYYNLITTLPGTGSSFYIYVDETAETNSTSYYYKAIVRDSCGNSRTTSNPSKTVLLKVEDDSNDMFTKRLKWTGYQGYLGGVSGYNIYRIINDVPSSSPVGTGGPTDTTYTDLLENEAPNGSKIDYRVEAVEGIGNIYGFMEKSNSNTVPVYVEGDVFVPSAFAPRGKNKIWLPVTHFVDKSEYNVTVYNRWGNKVFETNDDTQGWDGSGMTGDVYVYLIRYKNSRGEYKEAKGTVMLLE